MLVDYYSLDLVYLNKNTKEIQGEKYTYHGLPLSYTAQCHVINTIQKFMRREDIEIQGILFSKRTIEVDTNDITS